MSIAEKPPQQRSSTAQSHPRPQTWIEWEVRCQKPDHRRVGNGLARKVARPLALRITRVIAPWGVRPHTATFAAWAVGLAAIMAFGWGTAGGWLLGALLLHVWYLLDHVDGQLARYQHRETLDGAQLDYLMHHTLNLLLPVGLGWGIAQATLQGVWTLIGVAAGLGLLLISLVHDTRYKAFVKRWKRLHGELRLHGGGGSRPQPPSAPRRGWLPRGVWCARKLCEVQGVLLALPLIALVRWWADDATLVLPQIYLAGLALTSLALSGITLARNLQREAAEAEFAAWFSPPPGQTLRQIDGWWEVR